MKDNFYLPKVDILRAIAIIGVVVFHAQDFYYPHFINRSYEHFGWIAIHDKKNIILNFVPTAYGWSCVQFFLLISGFLIHLGYLKNNRSINFHTFINKRFWRIYPPYLLALLFFALGTSGYSYYFFTQKGLWDMISHLFLIHNLSDSTFFGINSAFWSLALEFQLYLIYPVFLWLLKKYDLRTAILVVAGISVLTTIIGMIFPYLEDIEAYRNSTPRNWIIWCAGALLAERFYAGKKLFRKNSPGLMIGVALLAIISRAVWITSYATLYLASLAWLLFFEWFLYKPINLISRLNKALTMIGICSYSIYLTHYPYLRNLLHFFFVFYFSPNQSKVFALLNQVPVYIILFFISYSMYQFIEVPAIAFGKKLIAKQQSRGLKIRYRYKLSMKKLARD